MRRDSQARNELVVRTALGVEVGGWGGEGGRGRGGEKRRRVIDRKMTECTKNDRGDVRDKIQTLGVAESRAGEDEGTWPLWTYDISVLVPVVFVVAHVSDFLCSGESGALHGRGTN